MKAIRLAAALATAIPMALLASSASAALTGATYNYSITGSSLKAGGGSGTATVPTGGHFCVGPAYDTCSSSGLSGSYSFADISPTLSTLTFDFSGSTYSSASPFYIDLSNFSLLGGQVITGMSLTSKKAMSEGSFTGVFSGGTLSFKGTPFYGFFDAVGGAKYVYDLNLSPVPIPATGLLLIGGLGALGMVRSRKQKTAA